MNQMTWLLLLPVVAVLALFVGYFSQKVATARKLGDADSRAQRILDDARRLVEQATRDAEGKAREAEAKIRAGELEAKELRQIERALVKIKNGTYGVCEGCQTKIPVARLNALPYSTLCVKCQQEMESNANWGGGRLGAGWDQIVDHDASEPNHVDLSNLELDLSR